MIERYRAVIERFLITMRAQIGYLEKASNSQLEDKTANAGYNNFTKYAAFLDELGVYNGPKNGFQWCDMFYDHGMIVTFGLKLAVQMIYQPMGGCGAGCIFSAQYYKDNGAFHLNNPWPGDQIFFSSDGGKTIYHTGCVVRRENGRVYTIEGNTSSAAGVVPNGGGVWEKSYPEDFWQIAGYGRPNWELALEMEGEFEMTQDQFNEMFRVAMAAYRADLQDNDAGNYSEEGRAFAIEKGLFVGGTPLADGTPNYMWQDFITREQFATVSKRMYDLLMTQAKA